MMKLTSPTRHGFSADVENVDAAKEYAARNWFTCSATEIVEVESPEGSATYLYESQAEADADADGAYAVKVQKV